MNIHPVKLRSGDPAQPPLGASGGVRGKLKTLLRGILAAGLAILALGFVLLALLTAFVLGSALVIWALLSGKRPAMGVFQQVYRRQRSAAGSRRSGQVVDVEVREVTEPEVK